MSYWFIHVLLFGVCLYHSKCQKNFFLAKKYYDYRYICVTNSSFALSWIKVPVKEDLSQVSDFVPSQKNKVDCSISEYEQCKNNYTKPPWSFKKSLETNVILDRRWERMETIKTEYVNGKGIQLKFRIVLSALRPNFEIPFSLRAEKEAHIFLCNGPEPHEYSCYWFMLQAWDGDGTAIRKCTPRSIPSVDGEYPPSPCFKPLIRINHTADFPSYFSAKEWSHFKIIKKVDTLTLKKVSERSSRKILKIKDKDNVINVSHMIIHSKQVNGLWKIHELEYLNAHETSQETILGPPIYPKDNLVCISVFLQMCSSCRVRFRLKEKESGKAVANMSYSGKEVLNWTEIKLIADKFQDSQFYLTVTTTAKNASDRFWSIDEIRQCQRQEYRTIALSEKASCQIMSDENNVISTTDVAEDVIDNSCPENTIGQFCMPCELLYDEDCKQITICSKHENDETKCYCSAGYYSKYKSSCYYDCDDGHYGHGCNNTCGHCYNYNSCDKISGNCYNDLCIEPYAPPRCDIAKGLYFKKPPSVTNVNFTEAIVSVTDFEISGIDELHRVPAYYLIQYKKKNKTGWMNFTSSEIFNKSKTITIKNLEPDTEYQLRCIITDNTNRPLTYSQLFVSSTSFKTKCEELTEDNFHLSPSNTSIYVNVTQFSRYACKMKNYHLSVSGRRAHFLQSENLFQLYDLEPYHNYTLIIEDNSKIFKKTFQTTEGVPQIVQSLSVAGVSSTSIHLQWQEPKMVYGILQYYYLEYKVI